MQRLHKEIVAASKNPEVRARMEMVGAEPGGSTQDEMRAMLREQVGKVKPVIERPEADACNSAVRKRSWTPGSVTPASAPWP